MKNKFEMKRIKIINIVSYLIQIISFTIICGTLFSDLPDSIEGRTLHIVSQNNVRNLLASLIIFTQIFRYQLKNK